MARSGAAGTGYTHRQVLEILSGLIMAMLTAMISTSVIATALPTIIGELGGQEQLAWVASAPLLTMTVATPLWGRLSDLFGRKAMFQAAVVLFAVSSLAAGFSQDIGGLIAARAVQGLGAGGVLSLTQIILGDVVPPRERGRYSGYLGAAYGVSMVAGPLVGGFLVDTPGLGWRWCFFVSVPLAVVASLIIWKVLRLPRPGRNAPRPKIDWFGAVTITGGATAIMLLLSLGGKEFAWHSPWTYGLVALGVLLLVLAVVAERRAAAPILPPRLFGDRTFVLSAASLLLVGVVMFGALIFLPQYLQLVRGMSPTASGLMTLPLVIGQMLASTLCGQFITRTGRWKAYPVAGLALLTLGMFLLSRLHVDSPLVLIGVDCAVIGVGLGMSMQILVLATQNAVPHADMAAATSGVSFFRSLGGAVGVAALGAVLTSRLATELTERLRAAHLPVPNGAGSELGTPEEIHDLPEPFQGLLLESFTDALQTAFLVCVPLALVALAGALALRELPLRTSAVPVPEPAEAVPVPKATEDTEAVKAAEAAEAAGPAGPRQDPTAVP
ncbi:drug resistance transporter, EmrB/QacA subfamily [Thermomonospora echinospora]|uniref:Drug resistance transporter, EmrB/QacA subfamily n=1 Tax=Thermomonospora echinospora TaxID=1992 RepID=A0A1H5Z5R7_9ACTN|nr:MDR family MFS transporter [Thermomonospora echinospora]SEG30706.1 drug resistance transporter, EmrB/QacA subfamily [Thermomonospora echinospora]